MSGFQVMPRLTAEEYDLLEQDILSNGVQVPIVVSQGGRIIDGHHRDEIARKHDRHCPRQTVDGTESELRNMAFRLNINRRHFTREQKRELIAESLKADPQLSDNEHKNRTGTSWATVNAVRSELEESSQIENFSERIDPRTGAASQPARRTSYETVDTSTGELDPEYGGKEYSRPEPKPQPAQRPPRPSRRPITDVLHGISVNIDRELTRFFDSADDRASTVTDDVETMTRNWRNIIRQIEDAYSVTKNETPAETGEGSQ